MSTVHPVILCGGSGTRLWPLSRGLYPKPLLPLWDGDSLLQQTLRRVAQIRNLGEITVICNEEHRFLVSQQAHELGQTVRILLEPVGRNTAPALTLAALDRLRTGHDGILLVSPADHVVQGLEHFISALDQGVPLAEAGYLVTFGVQPTRAETGYGYIQRGKNLSMSSGASSAGYSIERFVEKPDTDAAQRYVSQGGYFWNSGLFMLRAQRWLEEIGGLKPEILSICRNAHAHGVQDKDFFRVAKQAFASCPGDSIDYAVMEHTRRAAVVPLACQWSDVGTWSTFGQAHGTDNDGNAIKGDVLVDHVSGSVLISSHRLVAAVGLEDIVVVETADAVLVASKHADQQVKKIVEELNRRKRSEAISHRRVYRPWGSYEGIDQGERFQVKRLTVAAGASLSLQLHHHRAEHWIVVHGTARVTKGEEVFLLGENESTYIPLGVKHRLENPGTIPLEIIEVQSGSYLGEDDIVRFQDIYNRIPEPDTSADC